MPPLSDTFRVAVFDEFLEAFARLPRAQQKGVNKFLRSFRADPTSASINYEKIHSFVDPNLRTVRIDQAYRAIVLKPERGNVYVLLWVDNHDDAMRWAKNKRVVIHPETGSLQVLTAAPPLFEAQPESAPPSAQAVPLFGAYSDEDLVSLGAHPELLAAIRGILSLDQLEQLAPLLPRETWESLWFLGSGEPLEEVRRSLDVQTSPGVDTQDFAAALEKPASRRQFAVVTDDQALEAMLDAPLEKWRVFLHPSQRSLVERSFSGPARVLGGAGTGKTVVAMHRAVHLATKVFSGENDRILFTTFTRNLAADIQANLRKICPPAALGRIEVVHLDRWVSDFLAGQGYRYRIGYFPSDGLAALWQKALRYAPNGLPERFFREEWDEVIQPAGCATADDYRGVGRAGRGVRLSRKQRQDIWPVFEEYVNLLEAQALRESLDAMRDAARLLESGKGQGAYRSIVVDEGQDMSTIAFRLLRAIVPGEQPNDMFIVGDGHQRIYRRRAVLKQAGVNIVGRSRKLYLNYRTTDEIRRFAVGLLSGVAIDDLDGGSDDNRRYKSLSHGEPPEVKRFDSFAAEVDAIAEFIRSDDPSRTCLVTRTAELLDHYEAALHGRDIPTYRLRRSEEEDREAPGLRLATMHRVKGLEFDRIIVAGANEGVLPLRTPELDSEDEAVREDAERRERALLYVAITRARKAALVSCSGKPGPWLA